MGHLEWYDYLRMVTATISLLALYVSGRRAFKNWNDYTERLRELWWVFNAALLLFFEGSIEQIVTDMPWGPRTLLTFMVSTAALRAVIKKGGYLKSE